MLFCRLQQSRSVSASCSLSAVCRWARSMKLLDHMDKEQYSLIKYAWDGVRPKFICRIVILVYRVKNQFCKNWRFYFVGCQMQENFLAEDWIFNKNTVFDIFCLFEPSDVYQKYVLIKKNFHIDMILKNDFSSQT